MLPTAGIVIALISGAGFLVQVVSVVWPERAVKWGLQDSPDKVEPAFAADARGEAIWDILTIWTLPLGGILMALGSPFWRELCLIGGGMYLYFAGRGVASRAVLRRRGFSLGSPSDIRTAMVALIIWGAAGLLAVGLALAAPGA